MNQNVLYENSDAILLEDQGREVSIDDEKSYSEKKLNKKRLEFPWLNKIFHRCSLKNFSFVMIVVLLFIVVLLLLVMMTSKISVVYNNSTHIHVIPPITTSTTELPPSSLPQDSYEPSELPQSSKLFISDANQIRVYDLNTNKSYIHHEIDEDNLVIFDVVESSIFFIVNNSPVIRSAYDSEFSVKFTKRINPQALAVDHLTKKFYLLDKSAGTVNVMDFEGKKFGVVLSDLEDLHDIVLDVEEGLMFIIQYMKSILRTNSDGSDLQEIVKSKQISTLTIDQLGKKIFWYDHGSGVIVRSNYEGKNRIILTEDHSEVIESLSFHDNNLFWIRPSVNNKQASPWTCRINEGICEDRRRLPILLHNPKSIKVFENSSLSSNKIENLCEVNNGNCSDFCFMSSSKGKSCACNLGYRLSADSESCELVSDFILYLKSNYLKGTSLDSKQNDSFKDVIVSMPFPTFSYAIGGKFSFDYDVESDNFYFFDPQEKAIKFMSIKNDDVTKVLTRVESDVRSLLFDHASKNLYYDIKDLMMVQPVNNVTRDLVTIGANPTKINFDIDVSGGRIFLTAYRPNLYSVNTDGSNLKQMSCSGCYNGSYTLDYNESMIYFLENDGSFMIYKLPLNFSNSSATTPKSVRKSVPHMESIRVYKEYFYVYNKTSVWRASKNTNDTFVEIFGLKKETLYEMKIFTATSVPNECSINNGNCQYFCYAKPKKMCGCKKPYKLLNNGTCVA